MGHPAGHGCPQLDTKTAGHFLNRDTTIFVISLQRDDRCAQIIPLGRILDSEQALQRGQIERPCSGKQGRLDDVLQLFSFHIDPSTLQFRWFCLSLPLNENRTR